MPGCTAPNCSNSTQKGYKLYHFPSDTERCALWVKYCGRGEGWKPTRHTCVCEVHFEESQFESHRADGLRKLKPYAVPTKFGQIMPISRPRKRKKISEEPQNTLQKPEIAKKVARNKTDKGDKRDVNKDNKQQLRKRRTLIKQISTINKFHASNSKLLKQNVKSVGSLKKKYIANASRKESVKSVLHKFSIATEKVEESLPEGSEKNICFICNNKVKNILPLSTRTETSQLHLNQKLVQLVAVEFDLLVEDTGVLCTICAQTLNCIDYVESVLRTLSKGILNLMKKKFCMEPADVIDLHLYMKSLKNLKDFCVWGEVKEDVECISSELQHMSQSSKTVDPECTNQFCEIDNINDSERVHNIEDNQTDDIGSQAIDNTHIQKIDNTGNIQENSELEKSVVSHFECQICSYKAKYKALMVFHLRQHYQKLYSCDFCNIPIILDSSPSKEVQACNENCAVVNNLKNTVCDSDNSYKKLFPQSSKPQIDGASSNCDTLEKRDMCIVKKDKDERTQINENGNNTNSLMRTNREDESITLNRDNIPKDKSIVTFLSPMDMTAVTSLQNMNESEVNNACKSRLPENIGGTGTSEMSFCAANNLPLNGNKPSNDDTVTYTFLENYNDTSAIVPGISVESNDNV